jgi:small redox-active disulfide protein 2
MEIQICGPGCSKCDKTYTVVEKVVKDKGVEATIRKVSDFQEIARLGVFSTPAVVVDGEIKSAGKVPEENEVESWLPGK